MSAALTSIKVRHPIATSWKNRLHRAGQNIFSIFLRRRTESMDGRASLQYFSPNRFNDFISLNFIFNKRYYVISMGTYRVLRDEPFPLAYYFLLLFERLAIRNDVTSVWRGNFHFASVTAQSLRNGESGEVGLVRLTSATVIYLYSFSNRVS